ncbi:hypothetical protein [Ureaplasma canigenitalium]|uniref:hypothetical protein n=1 Tax=Ureaplasma canigenitalium TaxID=42092 RepID=UPI0004E1B931|nr:hypothetical protein [Ureaplasma canigenitalium]
MNKTYTEFLAQSKAKQIFTPWFISALVLFVALSSVAIAMVVLLAPSFEIGRRLFEDGLFKDVIADIKTQDSLMKFVEYDPHADYQKYYKILLDLRENGLLNDWASNIASHKPILPTEEYNEAYIKKATEAIEAFLHAHAQGLINHNNTWGFAVKVLGNFNSSTGVEITTKNGQTFYNDSWFAKFINEFRDVTATYHHNGHDVTLSSASQIRLQTLARAYIYLDQPEIVAYYWVFITTMMPQMITSVILIVKLVTVLKPKKTAEEKAAYKLAKLEKKNMKKNQSLMTNHVGA